jgi:hypothetical protein
MDRASSDSAAAHAAHAAQASRLAAQAAQALQELPQRVHPAWIDTLEVDPALLACAGPGLMSTVLQARFDLCWPDLSAASHARELAWLLPAGQLQRLCAARALYAFRGPLARSVDAASRRGARALLGTEAFDALLKLPEQRREERALPPLEADSIVVAGWGLLECQLPWRDARSRRLAELALPPAASLAGPVPGAGQAQAAEHVEFVTAVKHLFPEHQWLFGSELASLKSA